MRGLLPKSAPYANLSRASQPAIDQAAVGGVPYFIHYATALASITAYEIHAFAK